MTDENKPAETPSADEVTLVSKVSIGTMGCDPSRAKREGKRVPLARILGEARGIVEKVGQDGGAVYGITGQFEGTNIETKKRFQSGVCYLPPGVHEMVLGPLDEALAESGKAGAAVVFALDIFSVPAANKAGYTYESVDLAAATRRDPLAELKAAISDKALPKALAAPK